MNEESTDESTPTGKALGNVAAVALGIGTTAGLLFGGAAVTKGIGKMVRHRQSVKKKNNGSTKISRIVEEMNKDDKNGSQDVIDKTKMILNNKPIKEGKEYSKRKIRKATKQAQRDIVGEREYVKSLRNMQQEAESAKPKADVDVTEDLDEFDNDDLVNPMMKNIINQANGGEEVSTKPPVVENTTTTKPPVVENTQTTNTPKNNESSSDTAQPIFDESNMNGSPMRETENLTSAPQGGWNINNKEDYINLPETENFTSAPEGGWNVTYNKTPEAPEIQETVEPLKKKNRKDKKKEKMAENKRKKEERRNK